MSLLACFARSRLPNGIHCNGPRLARFCSTDHRDLAHHQKLLTASLYSPGSPLFLPNGADMMNKLTACLRAHYPQFGFREVITPNIYKRSLWEKSGHWDNYADDMFEVRGRGAMGQTEDADIGQDETFGLKPMNCPGHCLLFASEQRSYRDLPIRYADFSSLHRNEISGALSGLTRVRRFHQDDGHIFCRSSQIEDEIKKTMDFIELVYGDIFGMKDYRLVLSTRPDKDFIGTQQEWDRAEDQLKSALNSSGRQWSLSPGDGAFYGPKIDIILTDAHGKEHQTATIQLDFQLPQRFALQYDTSTTGDTGNIQETPVLIHRAVLGSLERFLALLLEHYNGTYPFWISPHPVIVLSVTSTLETLEYVDKVAATLEGVSSNKLKRKVPSHRPNLRVEKDISARSLGKKIREAKKAGYNFIVVVGPQDVENGTIAVQLSNQHEAEKSLKLLQNFITPSVDTKHIATYATVLRKFFEQMQDEYL